MIQVLNRHHFKGQDFPRPWTYIGRGTPLGNEVSKPGEPDALERYEDWLRWKLETRDPLVLGALAAIGPDHHLVCSCAPRPCHGDVVARLAEWLMGKGEW